MKIITDYDRVANRDMHNTHGGKGEPLTDIHLQMLGEDMNCFAIIGRGRKALRNGGREDIIEKFSKECTSGDYSNMLDTCFKYFIVD